MEIAEEGARSRSESSRLVAGGVEEQHDSCTTDVVDGKGEMRRMKSGWITAVAMVAALSMAQAAWGVTRCTMKFSIAGWSMMYSTASGSGTITCDNGQSAGASLEAKGGGLTVGTKKITGGNGTFSDVDDISELFGTYGSAEAHARVGKSSAAQVVTKGTVSLAFSGTGQGVDLGVAFGRFTIKRA